MQTRWVIVAKAEADEGGHEVSPPQSAVLTCPLCVRGVRAFARELRRDKTCVVFECPCCHALVEQVPWPFLDVLPLPGATLEELKAAIAQATMEAERWRCQADGARQRKDNAWADQAVAWAAAAELRIMLLQSQAATHDSETRDCRHEMGQSTG